MEIPLVTYELVVAILM